MTITAVTVFRIAEAYKPTRGKDIGLEGTIASGRFASLATQVAGALKRGDDKPLRQLDRKQLEHVADELKVPHMGRSDATVRTALHAKMTTGMPGGKGDTRRPTAAPGRQDTPDRALAERTMRERGGELSPAEDAAVDLLSSPDLEKYWTRRGRGETHQAALSNLQPSRGKLAAIADRKRAEMPALQKAQVDALGDDRADTYWTRRALGGSHSDAMAGLGPRGDSGKVAPAKAARKAAPRKAMPKPEAGDTVVWNDRSGGDEPALGRVVRVSSYAAYVEWKPGRKPERIKLTDLRDDDKLSLEKPAGSSPATPRKAAPAKKATAAADDRAKERAKLEKSVIKRYVAGESISDIASSEGRSTSFVHGILTKSGVQLRARGGQTTGQKARAEARKVAAAKKAAPSKAVQKMATPSAGSADHVAALRGAETREQARTVLQGLKKAQLLDMAREMDIPARASDSNKKLIDLLVERGVGNRLDSAAIRGTASLPY